MDVGIKTKSRWLISFVFMAAASIRIFHFFEICDTPFLTTQITDLGQFMYYARKLSEGDFFFKEKIFFNILYSFFLYFFHFILGLELKKIIFLQIAIDSFSAVLTTKITVKLSNQRSGLIAGLIYAFYGPFVFYAGLPLAETLSIFFLLLSIFALFHCLKPNKHLLFAFISGFLFAVSTLARPNIAISLPVILLLSYIKLRNDKRYAARLLAVLTAGFMLPLAPFMAHNRITAGILSPYTLHGGINLYIGNNSRSTGVMQAIEGISSRPGQQVLDSIKRASEISEKNLSPKEADAFWINQVLIFFSEHPFQALKLLARKTTLFVNTYEFACNTDYYFSKRFSSALNVPLFSFGIVFPLAALSFIIVRKKSFETSLVKFMFVFLSFSVVLFFVSARLRIVCVPFAVMLAGTALDRIHFLIKSKLKKEIYVSILILSFFLALAHVPVSTYGFNLNKTLSISYCNLGRNYLYNKNYSAAAKEFEKAVQWDPGNVSYLKYLGRTLEHLNQNLKALQIYKEILTYNTSDSDALLNIGKIYLNRKERKKALPYYIQAYHAAPQNHILSNTIGAIYLSLHDLKNAEKYFLEAIKANKAYPEPYYNLSIVYFGNKKYEPAVKYLEKAGELGFTPDPGYANELFSAVGKTDN